MELKKGINLGGFLSQCDHTEEHYETFIKRVDIIKIAKWGFDHVRLPVDYEVIETEDGIEKESGYTYIDNVIRWCADRNLNVVIDIHKVAGYDFNCANDAEKNNLFESEVLQERFMKLWERIAKRYAEKDNVAYELLNEVVETKNTESWNSLIKKVVAVIRRQAPVTTIIYGGIEWNAAKRIPDLAVLEDENILFTFHYYEPLLFTHQKAYWVEAMDPDENIPYTSNMEYFKEKSAKLGQQGHMVVDAKAQSMGMDFHKEMIEDALTYCQRNNIRLYCGEFGVIDRAEPEEALRWFRDVLTLFHKYHIGYAIWNYKDKDFGIEGEVYDGIRERLLGLL